EVPLRVPLTVCEDKIAHAFASAMILQSGHKVRRNWNETVFGRFLPLLPFQPESTVRLAADVQYVPREVEVSHFCISHFLFARPGVQEQKESKFFHGLAGGEKSLHFVATVDPYNLRRKVQAFHNLATARNVVCSEKGI